MKDPEIVKLFFARSEQAIEELTGKYGNAVRRVISNVLPNPRDTEECTNDTYLQVWNTIPPQRPQYLGAFVCRIARNLSLSRYHADNAQKRRSRYDVALDELEETVPALSTVESEYDAKELAACLNEFLARQPKQDRYLFLRRYWHGDSVAQIAQVTGMNAHAVSVRLYRVRQRLQAYLQKEGMLA